jgi:hypothetical protein
MEEGSEIGGRNFFGFAVGVLTESNNSPARKKRPWLAAPAIPAREPQAWNIPSPATALSLFSLWNIFSGWSTASNSN